VYDALVPEHTRKLYVHACPAQSVPAHPAIVRVTDGCEPSNFLRSFRVILRDGTATLVAANGSSVRSAAWRHIATRLQA
jgi:hypothetical protein